VSSVNSRANEGAQRFLQRRITRDAKVPLSADDLAMENGWRCIPMPPTTDGDWFIIDDNRDYKTEWARWIDREQHDN
jgi:hypothetical protein